MVGKLLWARPREPGACARDCASRGWAQGGVRCSETAGLAWDSPNNLYFLPPNRQNAGTWRKMAGKWPWARPREPGACARDCASRGWVQVGVRCSETAGLAWDSPDDLCFQLSDKEKMGRACGCWDLRRKISCCLYLRI